MATEIETMVKSASGCARRIRSLINKMPYVAPELATERWAMMIEDLDVLESQLRGIATVAGERADTATARAEGRTAERADVIAWLQLTERWDKCPGMWLAEQVEAEEHVGVAKEAAAHVRGLTKGGE